jgi:hypothetical protein
MEVDMMDKQERLDRMKRRKIAWETSRICKELVNEIADGLENAVTCSMVGALLGEMVDTAGSVGCMNVIVKEIINLGQVTRDQVEQKLRKNRLEDERIIRLVVADASREERLEDMARKQDAWRQRFARLEADKLSLKMSMLSVVDWSEVMEVDIVDRDVTKDVDGDTIMMDKSARKPTFAVKSRRRFQSRILRVTGRVDELGLVMEVAEPGETASIATTVGMVRDEGVQAGGQVEDTIAGIEGNTTIMEDLRMEDDNTMESGTIEETTQNRQIDGIKYCPDMSNVVLPSFIPVKIKPGFSGRLDQAEEMLIRKQQYQVCVICKDGPRCTVTHQTKTGLAMQDGSPCAASTWTAHPEIVVTVPGVQPYSVETACKAHPEGGTFTRSVRILLQTISLA